MQQLAKSDELQALLRREVECAGQLINILRCEFKALKQGDSVNLQQIVAQKSQSISALTRLSSERQQWLTAAGYPTADSAIDEYIQQMDAARRMPIEELRRSLRTLAQQAKRLNEINGGVVETSRRYLEHALAILQNRGAEVELYSPTAKTSHGPRSHSLGTV